MTDTHSNFKGRREDQRFITGQGRYTNDWSLDGQVYACFRRSDRAHAIITSIDTAAAKRSPGVLAVLTGQDVAQAGFGTVPPISPPPGRGGQGILAPNRPVLACDRVRFVGEEVAVVVAETQNAARDAAELIDVAYEDLPVLIGVERAMAAGAVAIHDNIPGNICFDFEYGDEKQVAEAFARAAGVVSLTAESPRVAPTPMEVRGALVAYDSATGSFDFYSANQGGPAFGHDLSIMSGVAPEKIRIRMLDVGGAFGARTAPFPEYPALMHLAKSLRRPVKWLSTRSEDFLTDNHGRAVSLRGELAYDENGKVSRDPDRLAVRFGRLSGAGGNSDQLDQWEVHRRRGISGRSHVRTSPPGDDEHRRRLMLIAVPGGQKPTILSNASSTRWPPNLMSILSISAVAI